jgi:peptidoglycan DL-endopeptidase CwlO
MRPPQIQPPPPTSWWPRLPCRTVARGAVSILVAVALLISVFAALAGPASADQIGDKQAEARQVADQLEALQARQMDLSAQAERVRYEQSLAEQRVAEAQDRLSEVATQVDQGRLAVRRLAVEAYENGNDSRDLDALLTSDANAGLQKKSYLEIRNSDLRDVVDELAVAHQRASDDKARLDAAQKVLDAKAAEMDALKRASDKAVTSQQTLAGRVSGELQVLVTAEQQRRAQTAATQPRDVPAAPTERGTTAAQTATPTTPPVQRPPAADPTPPTQAPPAGPTPTTTPRPVTDPSPIAPAPNPPPAGSRAAGAIAAAKTRVGLGSYVWGAAGPVDFDCSGLVVWAYAQVGVSLPHYSGAQYTRTTRISAAQLQPGDLVFWGPGGSEHVAIYIGGNQLVHAFGSGGGVNVTPLAGWWKPPTGYGRLNY